MLRRSTIALARRAATALPIRRAFTSAVPRCTSTSDPNRKHLQPLTIPTVSEHQQSSKDTSLGHAAVQTPATGKAMPNVDRRIEDIDNETDLLPEGAEVGTVPTDVEQATGLERLEILGKMQGIDIFDMKPLPSDRLGTLKDPIMVRSFGEEQYCGCTGCPADSHNVKWITVSALERLWG